MAAIPKPTKKTRQKPPKLDKLDKLARELCRRRGKCEAVGAAGVQCSGSLQWAHILSRSYHKVRWDLDNCLFMCAAHHTYYTFRPIEWRRYIISRIGEERLYELEQRAIADGKVDRFAVLQRLQEALDESDP